LPVRGTKGSLRLHPRIKMAQKLATLKQSSPEKSIRCSGSAAPKAVKFSS